MNPWMSFARVTIVLNYSKSNDTNFHVNYFLSVYKWLLYAHMLLRIFLMNKCRNLVQGLMLDLIIALRILNPSISGFK